MNISKNTPKKRKKETKTGLIIICIVAALVVLAIIFAAVNTSVQSPTHLVSVPAVETVLVSDTGTAHMFGARVVLEFDNSVGDLDQDQLHSEIRAAIDSLSYEDITSFQGPDIIRNAVRERVSGNMDEDALVAVFLTEVMSDAPMLNRDVDTGPRRNLMFDAVFGDRN